MTFKYNVSKKDLKKMFIKDYQKINIFYLLLTTIIFIIFTKEVMIDNVSTIIIFYLIVLFVLIMILFIINRLYASILVNVYKNNYGIFNITIDKNHITINDDKIELDEIKRITIKKDRIYLTYNKNTFLISKNFLENEEVFIEIQKRLNKTK